MDKTLVRVGFIGRWKPLHNGGASLLEAACAHADHVLIGIGSSNDDSLGIPFKYNHRNPFTPRETQGMIYSFLSPRFSNYETILIPDFAQKPEYENGQEWRNYVKNVMGRLDHLISGNPFVDELLQQDYHIIRPEEIIPKERWIYVNATTVRLEMASGEGWRALVPPEVAAYLDEHDLIERFRREFGQTTLNAYRNGKTKETSQGEHLHAREQ